MGGFENFLQYVANGEPVEAGVTNRAVRQLAQNLQYLRELLDANNAGATVYLRQQALKDTLKVGQPVYFNSTNARFEPAFAAVVTDPTTGYLQLPESAQVWGVVSAKSTATVGDILLFGVVTLDISEAVSGGTVSPGLWYLSGLGEGMLTKQQPPVSVPVLRTTNFGQVFVNPSFSDFLENHRHYRFDLSMVPAGDVTPPLVGGTHTIDNANDDLPGWLPSGHAIFAGKAPAGAKFGYNLSQHTALQDIWPPIPLQSASVEMQRPSVWDITEERKWFGQVLMPDLVVVNRDGIWWMSDCYDEVPWPTTLDSLGSASEIGDACDAVNKEAFLRLFFAKVNFATDTSMVRSLQSLDPRLLVVCAGDGTDGASGDLALDLDLELLAGDDNRSGALAIKEFEASTNKLHRGPVLSGLIANSPNMQITGDYYVNTVHGRAYYGNVRVGILSQASQEVASQLVRLDGATEESDPVLYLGLSAEYRSNYVAQFTIPADAPNSIKFKLRLRILGRAIGTLPQLVVDYYRAPRPVNGLVTPVEIAKVYASLPIVTVATLAAANYAVEATSDEITVLPGDIVYIRVQRNPTDAGDTYAGEVGIMHQTGVITPT
jgi:hypothetical protein